MPVWLQIVIAVVGAVGTICGILGITAYIQERQKHKAQKKNQSEDDAEAKALAEQKKLEQMRHEEYKAELRAIICEVMAPVNEKLTSIENDLGLVKGGLQKDLYVDLVHIYNEHMKKGYVTLGEKRDFDSLYWAYHKLGKNGVADGMHETIMNMPDSKPVTRRPKAKKQLLVENK